MRINTQENECRSAKASILNTELNINELNIN